MRNIEMGQQNIEPHTFKHIYTVSPWSSSFYFMAAQYL